GHRGLPPGLRRRGRARGARAAPRRARGEEQETAMNAAIEFRDVWRHFGEQEVLRGLSLAVRPGEVFALLGRNGAGKTTALRILLGSLEPQAGEARVLGSASGALAPAERDRIGYVSEGHRLYVEMRVRDALAFEAGTRPRFDRAAAARELERCGI